MQSKQVSQPPTPRSLRYTGRLLLAVVLALSMVGLPAAGYAVDASDIITTVAGNGTASYGGDGGPATAAGLNFPTGVAVDGAGNLYIADLSNRRVRKVDSAGTVTTVAGTGTFTGGGDGGPATAAMLQGPYRVALDANGNLYIADLNSHRIRKVDSAGIITTVAGTGLFGYSGDGGPATAAQFASPIGVVVDGAGNLYIADRMNQRIRKVDNAGIITTVAGNGAAGYSGDGGPATAAQLNFPTSVAVDAAGNLYIVDSFNGRIRKVDNDGIITTVVGNGLGYGGDGGPATAAQLFDPYDVTVDGAGALYIADRGNSRVRKVDSAGIITTVAGTGAAGYSGDGGPAGSAQVNLPIGVAVDGAGALYIADTTNHRVRRVATVANQAPVAVNDSYTTNEDTQLSVAAPGVLGNDSDADGDALTTVLVSGPSHGALTLNADGSFTYLPNLDFSTPSGHPDSFTYQASDGQASSNVATVTITVVSAATLLSQLIAQVQGLVNDGTLSAGNGNALLVKLQQTQSLLNKGKPADAISILQNDFIPQVQNYITDGVLTAADGQLLIDGANAVIVSLGPINQQVSSAAQLLIDEAQITRLFLPVVTR
jgi:VCBS repeat-containing protein